MAIFATPGLAQDISVYQEGLHITKGDTLPYRILLPKDYSPQSTYPLLLFLHGSGERGNDNKLQLVHGGSFFASDSIRDRFKAIVIFPQCPEGNKWSTYESDGQGKEKTYYYQIKTPYHKQQEQLITLVNQLVLNYPVDKNRLYVGGLSMGGMGTLELIKRNPNTFAAAFAICAGAHPKSARKIKKTPLWLFHGLEDNVVPAKYSQSLYEALLAKKARVKLTLYPDVQHDSWTNTFMEPQLLSWLFFFTK